MRESIDRLKADPRRMRPLSLIPHGGKIYSQNEEDGMIREIFRRIGVVHHTFVEFGVGDGLENNTLALLFEGWKGLWIEGSDESAARIRTGFSRAIANGSLRLTQAFITRDNINDLIGPHFQGEIDLLSVDIDGNDYHVFEAITCIRPRVVVMEYNAKFPPHLRLNMQYDAGHMWNTDDCMGASLKFLEEGLARHGYVLVGCDLIGANAFFVRNDLVEGRFLAPFTAENHYEAPKYHLAALKTGHKSSYKALERMLPPD